MPINLRTWTPNPIVIPDAVPLVAAFLAAGAGGEYDLVPVEQDAALGILEVWAANWLAAGLQAAEAVALFQPQTLAQINDALAEIPNNLSLYENDPRLAEGAPIWNALEELFRPFLAVPNIGFARTTKILHKKRPRLIPPIDSRAMQNVYREWMVPATPENLKQAIIHVRNDIMENLDALHAIRAEIPGLDGITIVRIFDMIVWERFG